MSKRRLIVAIVGLAAIVALFLAGRLTFDYSNAIDNVNWAGYPGLPCFLKAANCGGHILGTDEEGRDLLARLVVGAFVTLAVSLCALFLELVTYAAIQALARFTGNTVRYVVGRCADAVTAFTPWPFIMLVGGVLDVRQVEGWWRLTIVVLVASVLMSARLIRRRLPSADLPKTLAREWTTLILLLATIDFFGFGVMPPTASLGNMLADIQMNLQIAWWAAVLPGVSLFLICLLIEVAGRAGLSRTSLRLPEGPEGRDRASLEGAGRWRPSGPVAQR
jgi:peptide/nickel transport system permease protein